MEKENSVREIITIGGKVFINKEWSEAYEEGLTKIVDYKYYSILCKPELSEGKGYYDEILVGVEPTSDKNVLTQFLYKQFGELLAFIMGVAPMDN